MKYLTTSVWALSAAMLGGWVAYDYHVGVVEDWRIKYRDESDSHNKTIEALSAADHQYRELEAELSGAHNRNRNLDSENLFLYGLVEELTPEPIVNPDPLDTTVKVLLKGGHGSGTHIGNGYIITAGHVADKVGAINEVRFENGDTYKVETLWTSLPDQYDVALLRISGIQHIHLEDGQSVPADLSMWVSELPASNLECRLPDRGEEIRLFGNPQAYEFTVTYGHVSGGLRDFGDQWLEAIPVDAASAPGSSGGGMFDNDGDLIGILVGTSYSFAGGQYGTPISVGINVVIPASTICNLMGRS